MMGRQRVACPRSTSRAVRPRTCLTEPGCLVALIRCVVVALLAGVSVVFAAGSAPQSDLDAFMARVLQRRDENWKKLRQYVLDEREQAALVRSGAPLWGERRDYTWFIRDGMFVRSPLRVNGVDVPEDDRVEYEDEFARRAQSRERAGGDESTAGGPADVPSSAEALLTGAREPQFIDTAYFLKFKFEPGRYALVGRETFEGRDLVRIEYFPERLFDHERDDQSRRRAERRRDGNEDVEASTERMLNKVSLVTLWVEPEAHQIVRYTFDNVDIDFLPGAWLLRVTEARATMTMSQPFPDVWLPREVDMQFGAMLASGAMDVRYRLEYYNYREASTSGRMKVPGER